MADPKFRHHAATLALARMMHYLSSAVPMPDLSEGTCVGTDYPDNWHADIHRQMKARRVATYLCRTQCPVQATCATYALAPGNEELGGIWGGLSEKERADIRKGVRPFPREQQRRPA